MTTAIAFVTGLFSLWYHPLGLDVLSGVMAGAVYLVPVAAGIASGWLSRRYVGSVGAVLGFLIGIEAAWVLTNAIDPRPDPEGPWWWRAVLLAPLVAVPHLVTVLVRISSRQQSLGAR